jgi:outer membrane protein
MIRLGVYLTAFLSLYVLMNAQPQPISIDSLTLEQAVAVALDHHPSLRGADAGVQSAAAGLTQARSTYYPSLSASASVIHTDGAFVFNPDFPPRNQTYNSYAAGLQIQQTVIDFGKMVGRVSAGSSFVDAAELDYRAARGTVIMNVQLAYFNLVQAKQVVKVNAEAVDRATDHLKQAKAFYSVGKRAQFDVTKAEVDLANANVAVIISRNQLRLAKLQVDNAMGVHTPSMYKVIDSFDVPPFTTALDSVKAVTFERQPELLAARARVEANQSLVGVAWDQHLPTISASGTWNWTNFNFPLFSRWNAGLTLSLPIFQGFSIQAQVDQARANADIAKANLDVLNEEVMLEVEQNYLSLKEAEERIAATTKLVEQAEQSLTLAEKQYAAGVGGVIEVTDAQLALSNARITRIQALYDYNSSLVKLKRAAGMLEK